MKHILVTGASGYIGKAFIKALGTNYNLRLFSRSQVQSDYEFVQGDIKDLNHVTKASKGIDTILHLAAVSTDKQGTNDLEYFDTNTRGTLNVLEAASRNNIKKIIFASSICAVGFRGTLKLIKEDDCCQPSDGMYGYSKYLAEKLCKFYSEKYDISIICLRLATVIPQHDLVIPYKWIMPYWLGAVHINDVIQSIRLAIDNETIHYGVYHIASESQYSKFDISRAKRDLKFKPGYDFKALFKPSLASAVITAVIRLFLNIRHMLVRSSS